MNRNKGSSSSDHFDDTPQSRSHQTFEIEIRVSTNRLAVPDHVHCHRGGQGKVSPIRLTISSDRSRPDCAVAKNCNEDGTSAFCFTACSRAGVLRTSKNTLCCFAQYLQLTISRPQLSTFFTVRLRAGAGSFCHPATDTSQIEDTVCWTGIVTRQVQCDFYLRPGRTMCTPFWETRATHHGRIIQFSCQT